ncbi:unnamed protein product [Vitrella brassicaformis CCMP3155]|uniref:Uncharacterized protein n=2 Tax=Vitrella brassicaformis TaxID=1169539 RepID=A0A0G4H064_VITBC|nr:unnamed protein product [Vitrella brassicaformis CCMP3155]|eukprot:CEM36799.1 unnamed protein product [Vitrella brassicaformis CCMP3155]
MRVACEVETIIITPPRRGGDPSQSGGSNAMAFAMGRPSDCNGRYRWAVWRHPSESVAKRKALERCPCCEIEWSADGSNGEKCIAIDTFNDKRGLYWAARSSRSAAKRKTCQYRDKPSDCDTHNFVRCADD